MIQERMLEKLARVVKHTAVSAATRAPVRMVAVGMMSGE
jgi:hypothetical protein